jgi:hypothetical protein
VTVTPKTTAPHVPPLLLAAAAALLLFQLAAGLLFAPPGHDGSYYLAHARYVRRGLTPYRDFPTQYAPGAYYLSAWVGERGLADPVLGKVPMYLAELANVGLLYLILRRLGHGAGAAAFGAVLCALWVIACGGDRVFLEPFQNTFALLGFAVLLYSRSPVGCALAGLAAGAALMMKQLSLPVVPGLLLLALAPTAEDGVSRRTWAGRVAGGAAFLACVGVPFLVFVLLCRLDFLATFKHLASFGGGGGSYGNFAWRDLFANLFERPAALALPLYPCAVLAAWLLVRERAWETASLAVLFFGFLSVLCIQTHGHYIQLAAPWGVLVLAETFRRLDLRGGHAEAARSLLAAVVLAWFVPGVLSAARESVRYVKNRPFEGLRQVNAEVVEKLPEHDNVLIINAPWIYLVGDVTPPGRQHQFVRPRDLDAPWFLDQARACDYAVVVPYGHAGRFPLEKAQAALEGAGLTYDGEVPVDTEILGEDRPQAPGRILFFARKPPTGGR